MENEMPTIRLGELAHARSGDKGNSANIGVVARDDASFIWLRSHLTEARVAAHLGGPAEDSVRRYELPALRAFNFVIKDALAGGASRSLRLDTQGKALGVALLELRLPGPSHDASENLEENPR